jgi:hypothetical protein
MDESRIAADHLMVAPNLGLVPGNVALSACDSSAHHV